MYCPICEFDEKIRHIKVRGLCPETIFNPDYILTKDENGDLLFLGHFTSSIKFDKTQQIWRWFDQKDNKSVAIRKRHNLTNYNEKNFNFIIFDL